MQSFKKAFFVSVAFILTFVIALSVVLMPAMANGSDYNDSAVRKELSGSLDYLFIGASHCMASFVPNVIDEELGVNSYNLSSSAASMEGKMYLLKKEIERNSLDTVVIDIAFDTLLRRPENDHARGEAMVVCKLDSMAERIKYTVNSVSFFNSDYENFFSVFSRYGISAWKKLLSGEETFYNNGEKGFVPEKTCDVTLTDYEITSSYNLGTLDLNYSKKNVEILQEMIRLCKVNNIRTVVLVIPISEARIWKTSNWSGFVQSIKNICDTENCEFYDYNLIKNRSEIFSDDVSFVNQTHMSETGAWAFSLRFAQIEKMLQQDGNKINVDELFYSSYDEMKTDSQYMEYYLSHKDVSGQTNAEQ